MLLCMQVTLAHIGSRAGSKDELDGSVQGYLERCSGLVKCRTEGFKTEEALLDWLDRQEGDALRPWWCCWTAGGSR